MKASRKQNEVKFPTSRKDFAGAESALSHEVRRILSGPRSEFRRIVARIGKKSSSQPPIKRSVEFDADRDRRYANSDPRFDEVVHVFNQEWQGIRSAAGTLPGHKIAYAYPQKITSVDLVEIKSHLRLWNIRKAVIHGFSDNAESILGCLLSEGVTCHLVWHGNLAQLVWKEESYYFNRALEASRSGRIERAHMLKAGMSDVFPNAFAPMLLNSPPRVEQKRLATAFSSGRVVALVPAHTDIRKNVYTSLLGAALSSDVDDVLYYGDLRANIPALSRCKKVKYMGHEAHLAFLREIDVTINVTAIDCHPMVDLEALGCGAVGITGQLFLDALSGHPYTKLTTIINPFDFMDVRRRLNLLRNMDCNEIHDIAKDYSRELTRLSIERYSDFVGL